MNPDIAADDKSPKYRLSRFEGPLDLLLFLIRKNEVSIYDISVTEITMQYLTHLKNSPKINLDEISEFYLMATTLLNIKSKMLLPIDIDLGDELEDPRQELVERLIEYEKFRKLTCLLSDKEISLDEIARKKGPRVIHLPAVEKDTWEKVDAWDLLKTFDRLMKSLGGESTTSIWEEVSINEKITLINEFLETKDSFDFYDICSAAGSLMDIISAFLAVLELTKMGMIKLSQNELFGSVRITASKREIWTSNLGYE